ncbi:acetyl xylan esterase [Solitalea longa]|uniref:Acetyl xylan esterase n=1 Tax=Solitalea longa TaxID=2079460 RepID=A0A2S5A2Z0_9SPHI|nr:SGNH/GDSL hydrolase family protein [Solitalea longa]POY36652.1 acetyl xylan esterase [Solitalea longa]
MKLNLRSILLGTLMMIGSSVYAASATDSLAFFKASEAVIQYTGRIDFSNPQLPRFWQPGVYIKIGFKGPYCQLHINDEVLYGSSHNYITIVVDNGKPQRMQLKDKTNVIKVAENLSDGEHTVLICKDTEANIGYIEFAGINCRELTALPDKPKHLIEYIGDSITCGTGSDESAVPCGKGAWHDQHNAYLAYGPITARELNAQWHLSSVSGIGLMHSCCDMNIIMPQVFDKVSMRDNKIKWDFKNYQPDVVSVCLGQNDGIQDATAFCNNYIAFVKLLRVYYPKATIVCMSSPMADEKLRNFQKEQLNAVVSTLKASGLKDIYMHCFEKSYNAGCDWHPSLAEHQVIAAELTDFLKKIMKW